MSEKRFEVVTGVDNNVNREAYFIQDTYEGCILGGSYWKEEWAKKDCNLLNNINDEKNHLQNVIDLLEYQLKVQDIATRTEEEKEYYNQCCRHKSSDEAIKQAYSDLNRREREKHSQGNATYVAKMNQNEVIY